MNTQPHTSRPARQRYRETPEFTGMVTRGARALGQRVASGEVENLGQFARAQEALVLAKWQAIQGLRDFGYSWAEIGDSLGITRQAAHKWHRDNAGRFTQTPAA